MADKITYEDKVANGGIPQEGVISGPDMNEIKTVVNSNADALTPGISLSQAAGGIASQALTTSYTRVCLTNTVIFETPAGVIETTYPGGCDSVKVLITGIYQFTVTIYVEGSNNAILFLKAYKNGVEISPGDPLGVNLLGSSKPVAVPFISHIPLAANDVITYYGRMDTTGSFTINSCNSTWERTNY